MRDTIKIIGGVIAGAILLDIMILMLAILQLGIEGQTGYWPPFWAEQARFVISTIN